MTDSQNVVYIQSYWWRIETVVINHVCWGSAVLEADVDLAYCVSVQHPSPLNAHSFSKQTGAGHKGQGLNTPEDTQQNILSVIAKCWNKQGEREPHTHIGVPSYPQSHLSPTLLLRGLCMGSEMQTSAGQSVIAPLFGETLKMCVILAEVSSCHIVMILLQIDGGLEGCWDMRELCYHL